jgi:organic hydroperoxide reductase OsmC/OhrA
MNVPEMGCAKPATCSPSGGFIEVVVEWGGDRTPSAEQLDKMHHAAHENCFIANSVKTDVTVTKL